MFQTYMDEGSYIFQKQCKPGPNYHQENNPLSPMVYGNSSAQRLGDPRHSAKSSSQHFHLINVTSPTENAGGNNSTENYTYLPPVVDNQFSRKKIQREKLVRTENGFLDFLMRNRHIMLKSVWETEIIPSKVQNCKENVAQNSEHTVSSMSDEEVIDYLSGFTRLSWESLDTYSLEQHKQSLPCSNQSREEDNVLNIQTCSRENFSNISHARFQDSFHSSQIHVSALISEAIEEVHSNDTSETFSIAGSKDVTEWYQSHRESDSHVSLEKKAALVSKMNVNKSALSSSNIMDPHSKRRCRKYLVSGKCLKNDCGYFHRYPKDDNIICRHFLERRCNLSASACNYKHVDVRSDHILNDSGSTRMKSSPECEKPVNANCETTFSESLNSYSFQEQSPSLSNQCQSNPNKEVESVLNIQTSRREDLSNKSLSNAGDQQSFNSSTIHVSPLISEASKEVDSNNTETFNIAGSKDVTESFQFQTEPDSSISFEKKAALVSKMNVNQSAMSSSNIMDSNSKRRCRRYLLSGKCLKTDCKFLHRYPKEDNILCSYFVDGSCKWSASACNYKHGDVREEHIVNSGSTCIKSSSVLEEPETTFSNSVGKLLGHLKKPSFPTDLKQNKANDILEHLPKNISPQRIEKTQEKLQPLKASTHVDTKSSGTPVPQNCKKMSNTCNGLYDKTKETCDTENFNSVKSVLVSDGYVEQSRINIVGHNFPTKTDGKQLLLLENEKFVVKSSASKQSGTKPDAAEGNKVSAAVSKKQNVAGTNNTPISGHKINMASKNKNLKGKSSRSGSSSTLSKEQMCDQSNKGNTVLGNQNKKEKPGRSIGNMKEQSATKNIDNATHVNHEKLAHGTNLEDKNLNKMSNKKSTENVKSDKSQVTKTKVVEKNSIEKEKSHDLKKMKVIYGAVENLKQEKRHKRSLESNEEGSVKKVKSKETGISMEENTDSIIGLQNIVHQSRLEQYVTDDNYRNSEQHKSDTTDGKSEKKRNPSENSAKKDKLNDHSSLKSQKHKSSRKTDGVCKVKSKENRKRLSENKEERIGKKSRHSIVDMGITTGKVISAGTTQESFLDLSDCNKIDNISKQNLSTSHSVDAGSQLYSSVADVAQESGLNKSAKLKVGESSESNLEKCKFPDSYIMSSTLHGVPGNILKGNDLKQHAMKDRDFTSIKSESIEPNVCDFIKQEEEIEDINREEEIEDINQEEIEDNSILPEFTCTSEDELLKITRLLCKSNSDFEKLCDELHEWWCVGGFTDIKPFTSGSTNKYIILEANIRVFLTCLYINEDEGLKVRNNILLHWEMEPTLQAYIDKIKQL